MPDSGTSNHSMDRLDVYLREGRSLSGHEKNFVFLNTDDERRRFSNISAVSGFDVDGDGRGLAFTDLDADGDLDAWISNRTAPMVQYFENKHGATAGNFVAFDLIGTTGNRDAIGARVQVWRKDDKVPLSRTLRAGEGFQSQSSKRLHFGLGSAEVINKVIVRWPSGQSREESFEGAKPNGFFVLQEGTGQARKIVPKGTTIPKVEVTRSDRGSKRKAIRMPTRPVFPDLQCRSLQDSASAFTTSSVDQPFLVVLWRAECAQCVEELTALAKNEGVLRKHGLEVLALTPDSEDRNRALALISKTKFPFRTATVGETSLDHLLVLHRHLFYRPYDLVVPTAFLLDENHRLAAVYRGGIEIGELKEDVAALPLHGDALWQSAAPMPGRRIAPIQGNRSTHLIKAFIENAMPEAAEHVYRIESADPSVNKQAAEIARTIGESYLYRRNYAHAGRVLAEALKLDPSQPTTLNNLGAVALSGGKTEEAKRLWKKATELDADYPGPRLNLGKQLMKEGNTKAAMPLLEEFSRLEPESPDGHHYLAMGHIRMRQFESAEFHLKRLIKLRPTAGDAYSNLAKIYLQGRNLPAAREILDHALTVESLSPKAREALRRLRARLD